MFDIGWQEIFIIGILALIVVGPKDLPQAVRTISQWIRKARSMASELQGGVNEMIREAELDDIKKQITDAKSFDLQAELEKNIDPSGEIADGLGLDKEPMDEDAEGLSQDTKTKDIETKDSKEQASVSEGPIAETYGANQSVPVG
ncbi:MAG: twin-arginine translocase subunit TatB, partial [Rhodospirillaceae bacterium]|nr:twin-arginine translocase subunit TatB [Rhodospirillaceae bacterium]